MKLNTITLKNEEIRKLITSSLSEEILRLTVLDEKLGNITGKKRIDEIDDLRKEQKKINNEIDFYNEKLSSNELSELDKEKFETGLKSKKYLSDVNLSKISRETEKLNAYKKYKKTIESISKEYEKARLDKLKTIYNGDFPYEEIPTIIMIFYSIFLAVKSVLYAVTGGYIVPYRIEIAQPDLYKAEPEAEKKLKEKKIKVLTAKKNLKYDITENIANLKKVNLALIQIPDTIELRSDVKDKQTYLAILKDRFKSDLSYLGQDLALANLQSSISTPRKDGLGEEREKINDDIGSYNEKLSSAYQSKKSARFNTRIEVKEFTTSAAELYMKSVNVDKVENWEEQIQLIDLYEQVAEVHNNPSAIEKLKKAAKSISSNQEFVKCVDHICNKEADNEQVKAIKSTIDAQYKRYQEGIRKKRKHKFGQILENLNFDMDKISTISHEQQSNSGDKSQKPAMKNTDKFSP